MSNCRQKEDDCSPLSSNAISREIERREEEGEEGEEREKGEEGEEGEKEREGGEEGKPDLWEGMDEGAGE